MPTTNHGISVSEQQDPHQTSISTTAIIQDFTNLLHSCPSQMPPSIATSPRVMTEKFKNTYDSRTAASTGAPPKETITTITFSPPRAHLLRDEVSVYRTCHRKAMLAYLCLHRRTFSSKRRRIRASFRLDRFKILVTSNYSSHVFLISVCSVTVHPYTSHV